MNDHYEVSTPTHQLPPAPPRGDRMAAEHLPPQWRAFDGWLSYDTCRAMTIWWTDLAVHYGRLFAAGAEDSREDMEIAGDRADQWARLMVAAGRSVGRKVKVL